MRYFLFFALLLLPNFALADITVQFFGSDGSFYTYGTNVVVCDDLFNTYLRSDPNEINFEGTPATCSDTDLSDYTSKNYFYAVENNTNQVSDNFYWCSTFDFFTMNSDHTTGCPTTEESIASTTPATLDDISLALSIIIVILSVLLTAFIFNKMTSKKPWS